MPTQAAYKPASTIFDRLTDEQREAVEAVTGPVCIHAGAGTGKTSTITRRIANQILSGAFEERQILGVTFTDKAANQLRATLKSLGIHSVRAKTFHAEALAQISALEGPQQLLGSKAAILAPIASRLPRAYRFRPIRDLASEIERAKNNLVTPPMYLDSLNGHAPPIPPDLMVSVFTTYEARKRKANLLDFEDLLLRATLLINEVDEYRERVRQRYAAFTVDEYQDVNPLQQGLLEAWLGPSQEVCVVGDDRQSIYGFTGASSSWLTTFSDRYPTARSLSLSKNFRSSQPILNFANRLASEMTNASVNRALEAAEPLGADPTMVASADEADEINVVVSKIVQLLSKGVQANEIAILYRINARSQPWERALASAGIPTNVHGGGFAQRLRAVVSKASKFDPAVEAKTAIESVARSMGWTPDATPTGDEEVSRIEDLTRLIDLAGDEPLGVFLEGLDVLSGKGGVVLSTLHRSKGLEFDAVFVVHLTDRELPFSSRGAKTNVDEERRLLYVGITRARKHLTLSWPNTIQGKSQTRSRFLAEVLPPTRSGSSSQPARPTTHPVYGKVRCGELFTRLREWRTKTAAKLGVPAFVIFHDKTLNLIASVRPQSLEQLTEIEGIGPNKLMLYGDDILKLVAQ